MNPVRIYLPYLFPLPRLGFALALWLAMQVCSTAYAVPPVIGSAGFVTPQGVMTGCTMTIQSALNVAPTGSTIFVRPAAYGLNQPLEVPATANVTMRPGGVGCAAIPPAAGGGDQLLLILGGRLVTHDISVGLGSGPDGGVIELRQGSRLEMSNGTIALGTASNSGGCIAATGIGVEITLTDMTIEDCRSGPGGGGAIELLGGSLTMDGGSVRETSTSGNGGAIRVGGGSAVLLDDILLTNSKAAGNGGAIFADESSQVEVLGSRIVPGTHVRGDVPLTALDGGAVYLDRMQYWQSRRACGRFERRPM